MIYFLPILLIIEYKTCSSCINYVLQCAIPFTAGKMAQKCLLFSEYCICLKKKLKHFLFLAAAQRPRLGVKQPYARPKRPQMRQIVVFTISIYTAVRLTRTEWQTTCVDLGSLPVAQFTPTRRPWWDRLHGGTGPAPWVDYFWQGSIQSLRILKLLGCTWHWLRRSKFIQNLVSYPCLETILYNMYKAWNSWCHCLLLLSVLCANKSLLIFIFKKNEWWASNPWPYLLLKTGLFAHPIDVLSSIKHEIHFQHY